MQARGSALLVVRNSFVDKAVSIATASMPGIVVSNSLQAEMFVVLVIAVS